MNHHTKVGVFAGVIAFASIGSFLGALALVAATGPHLQAGFSLTPCAAPKFNVPIDGGGGRVVAIIPVSISYKFEVYHTPKVGVPATIADPALKPVTWYICNMLVVNDGLDILSQLTGNNKTGSASYMSATTSSTFSATDTTCAGEQTTNGFTRANVLSTFTHTVGQSTYTLNHQWTYTGSTSVTIAGACLFEHSGAYDGVQSATRVLIDETALGSSATVNANGDQLTITATITV